MFYYFLGMNILSNDDSLAWTISDNTSGSNKSKRGGAGKPKAATSSQDVLTGHISKYLSASAKVENDHAARQLAIEEEKLKLDKRKMDLEEKQHALAEQQLHYQGYGIAYGGPRSGQQYHDHRYGRQYHDDRQGYRNDDRQGYRNDDRQGYRNDDRQGYRNDDRQGYRYDNRQGYPFDDMQGYRHGSSSSSSSNYDPQRQHDNPYKVN